ncbi:MAG: DUF4097 family beta strand repeat-containing protein [Pyrinomonadaceae bacterium]
MSWLYSIIVAGLVFSSGGDGGPQRPEAVPADAVAVRSVTDETEKFEQTYPLNASGRVNVSNVNGSIVVEAWDRSEVKLEYVKTADTRDRLSVVEIKIDARPESFSVEADYGRRNSGDRYRNGGRLTVEFRLMVPRGAVLNEIETVNGSASVANFTNFTRVSAVNGSVKATNLRGTAKLSTVNGEVDADFDRLEPGSKISLDTVNGTVKLLIPSDANATVRADSLNGNITNDFGLPVRKGKYVGRDLYGRLGSGDVQIKLDSVNGGLTIGRKNDGKSLSPATNLLTQKEADDDNWDDDAKSVAKSAKINKEVEKAIRDSAKESAKAIAEAQVSLAAIQPEIARITAQSVAAAAEAITTRVFSSEKVQEQLRSAQARMADSDFFATVPRIVKKSETFSVRGVPEVTVKGAGCSVSVRGWDKSEIQYRVTQFTDPRNRSEINMTESHTETSLNLAVENPSYSARNGSLFEQNREVRIEVFVPRKTNLKIEANGAIRLEGVTGEIVLKGGDETVNVRDSGGKLNVTNADGQVRIIGFTGDLTAKTEDGEVRIDGDFSRIAASSVDGRFVLTLPEGFDGEIQTPGNRLTIEDLPNNTRLSDNRWRFGKGGGRTYDFSQVEGSVIIQNRDLIDGDN